MRLGRVDGAANAEGRSVRTEDCNPRLIGPWYVRAVALPTFTTIAAAMVRGYDQRGLVLVLWNALCGLPKTLYALVAAVGGV